MCLHCIYIRSISSTVLSIKEINKLKNEIDSLSRANQQLNETNDLLRNVLESLQHKASSRLDEHHQQQQQQLQHLQQQHKYKEQQQQMMSENSFVDSAMASLSLTPSTPNMHATTTTTTTTNKPFAARHRTLTYPIQYSNKHATFSDSTFESDEENGKSRRRLWFVCLCVTLTIYIAICRLATQRAATIRPHSTRPSTWTAKATSTCTTRTAAAATSDSRTFTCTRHHRVAAALAAPAAATARTSKQAQGRRTQQLTLLPLPPPPPRTSRISPT